MQKSIQIVNSNTNSMQIVCKELTSILLIFYCAIFYTWLKFVLDLNF